MSSKVQICNMALQRIGANRITSLSDGTSESIICNDVYDHVADEVMCEGPWSTCIRRQDLAQLAEEPVNGYDYYYQLPSDPYCLRVLNIDETKVGDSSYAVEGRKIATDLATLSIRYIARLTDPEDYGPMLTKAVTARLAAELCYALGANSNTTQLMWRLYEGTLSHSLAVDSQQGSNEFIISDDLLDVR